MRKVIRGEDGEVVERQHSGVLTLSRSRITSSAPVGWSSVFALMRPLQERPSRITSFARAVPGNGYGE